MVNFKPHQMFITVTRVTAAVLCLQLLRPAAAAPATLSLPALQLLESLGLPSFSLDHITVGERLRQQDSPIYYIKMPPSPPHHNGIDFNGQDFGFYQESTTTKFPFHQVPVDFTNNGRPEQIYHWSQPSSSDHHWDYEPFSSSSTTTTPKPTTTPEPTTTTTTKPYKLPSIEPWPPVKVPTKKPWVSFVKQFSSNGKPSGLYIYKSKPVNKPTKYRHPLFRHFNY